MAHSVSGWTPGVQVKLWDSLRTRAMSALEVWSRRGAIQIHVYLYLYCHTSWGTPMETVSHSFVRTYVNTFFCERVVTPWNSLKITPDTVRCIAALKSLISSPGARFSKKNLITNLRKSYEKYDLWKTEDDRAIINKILHKSHEKVRTKLCKTFEELTTTLQVS